MQGICLADILLKRFLSLPPKIQRAVVHPMFGRFVQHSHHGAVKTFATFRMSRLAEGVEHTRHAEVVMPRQFPKRDSIGQFHYLRVPVAIKPHIMEIAFATFAVALQRALIAAEVVCELRTDDRCRRPVTASFHGGEYPLDKIVVPLHLTVAEPRNIRQRMRYRPIRFFPEETQQQSVLRSWLCRKVRLPFGHYPQPIACPIRLLATQELLDSLP